MVAGTCSTAMARMADQRVKHALAKVAQCQWGASAAFFMGGPRPHEGPTASADGSFDLRRMRWRALLAGVDAGYF